MIISGKKYAMFVHKNFGAGSFDFDLIYRIENALKESGLWHTAFAAHFVEWEGQPGEELVYEPYGRCVWQEEENDILRISRAFPECQFCLHVGETDDRSFEYAVYFCNGVSETVYPDDEDDCPDPVSNLW